MIGDEVIEDSMQTACSKIGFRKLCYTEYDYYNSQTALGIVYTSDDLANFMKLSFMVLSTADKKKIQNERSDNSNCPFLEKFWMTELYIC